MFLINICTAVLKKQDDYAFRILNDFGKIKWDEAQASQNKFRTKFKGKQPSAVKTPYKQ